MKNNRQYAFMRGWQFIAPAHREKFKAEIMAALNITSHMGFLHRRRGLVEPKVSEAEAIVAVFKKYGVAPENIWGAAKKDEKSN